MEGLASLASVAAELSGMPDGADPTAVIAAGREIDWHPKVTPATDYFAAA